MWFIGFLKFIGKFFFFLIFIENIIFCNILLYYFNVSLIKDSVFFVVKVVNELFFNVIVEYWIREVF